MKFKRFNLFPWEFSKDQLLEFCSDSWSIQITNNNVFTITPIEDNYVFDDYSIIEKIVITFDENKDLIIGQKLYFINCSVSSLNLLDLLSLMTHDKASLYYKSTTQDNGVNAYIYLAFIKNMQAQYYIYWKSENETQIAVNYCCPIELTNP